MARPKKPTALLLMEGKTHLGKAEIEYRQRGEKALQTGGTFRETAQVKSDPVAHAEFARLKQLYTKIEFVDALDEQAINRYCLELSNVVRLQEMSKGIGADLASAETAEERSRLYGQFHKVQVDMSRNLERLFKYEDRLFLNPAARIRAVPKTPPKVETKGGMAAFLARREEG
jgi:phage terminase small subunit